MTAGFEEMAELFEGARVLRGADRERFLQERCSDAALREQVVQLLAHHDIEAEADEADSGPTLAAAEGNGFDPSVGESIGGYRILRTLGHGGMGTVYLAEQDSPKRRVALKLIRADLQSAHLLKRFEFEANILGRLQHPGIASVYEAGVHRSGDEGQIERPFFAMEFVDGSTLTEYADRQQLSVRDRLRLMVKICDAMEHAHNKGVIHRDLKPGNILVDATGDPKVLDFGVARATEADVQVVTLRTQVGQLLGTLPYMSPEQTTGRPEELDTRSDVYALGVILYELLTGKLPHDLRDRPVPAVIREIQESDATALRFIDSQFRGDLDCITSKALEKDKTRRYSSAAELGADLRRYLTNEPISARPASVFYQFRKFAKRNRGLVTGLAASAMALVMGTVVAILFAVEARQSEDLERKKSYILSVNLAGVALDQGDPARAEQTLLEIRPEDRGWEARHLAAALESTHAEYLIPGSSNDDDLGNQHRPYHRGEHRVAWPKGGSPVGAFVRGRLIHIVDVVTGEVACRVQAGSHVERLALSPDASRVAAVDPSSNTLRAWSARDGTLLFERSIGRVAWRLRRALRFCPKGETLAYIEGKGERGVRVTVCDASTGAARWSAPDTAVFAVAAFAFDAAGAKLFVQFAGDAAAASVYRVTDGRLLAKRLTLNRELYPRRRTMVEYDAVWSRDGRWIVGLERQAEFNVYDALTLEVIGGGPQGRAGLALTSFAGAGQSIAIAHGDRLRVWRLNSFAAVGGDSVGVARDDVSNVRPEQVLLAPTDSLAVDDTGSRLVVGAEHGFRVLDIGMRGVTRLQGDGYLNYASWSPDGRMVATAGYGPSVRLWDYPTGQLIAVLPTPHHQLRIRGLGFSEDGARIVALSDGLHVWDCATGEPVEVLATATDAAFYKRVGGAAKSGPWRVRGGRGVVSAMSRDGSKLLTSGSDWESGICPIQLLDGESLEEQMSFGVGEGATRRKDPTRAVAISADKQRYATHDGEWLRLWNSAGGLLTEVESNALYGIDFSPDGSRIACASEEGTILLRDAETLEPIYELKGHGYYAYSVEFSPDGRSLASSSGDCSACIWHTDTVSDRLRLAERSREDRARMEPRVRESLGRLGSAELVAAQLREDTKLSADERRAGLRVLLSLTAAGRRAATLLEGGGPDSPEESVESVEPHVVVASSTEAHAPGTTQARLADSAQEVWELLPPELEVNEGLGARVAVDGEVALLSAPGGAVHVYRKRDGGWDYEQRLSALADLQVSRFGGVSVCGDRIAVGAFAKAEGPGAVQVYRFDGGRWHEEVRLGPPADGVGIGFGTAVSIRGDELAVGAPTVAGSVHMFRFDGTGWNRQQVLRGAGEPGDYLGNSLVLGDGVLIVGAVRAARHAPESGSAHIYRKVLGRWVFEAELQPKDPVSYQGFGRCVAIEGGRALVAACYPGEESAAIYAFERIAGVWTQTQKITPDERAPTDYGRSLSLSGGLFVVGAPHSDQGGVDAGAAHLFRHDGRGWRRETVLTIPYQYIEDVPTEKYFGSAVAVDGQTIVVGAPGVDRASREGGAGFTFRP